MDVLWTASDILEGLRKARVETVALGYCFMDIARGLIGLASSVRRER